MFPYLLVGTIFCYAGSTDVENILSVAQRKEIALVVETRHNYFGVNINNLNPHNIVDGLFVKGK